MLIELNIIEKMMNFYEALNQLKNKLWILKIFLS